MKRLYIAGTLLCTLAAGAALFFGSQPKENKGPKKDAAPTIALPRKAASQPHEGTPPPTPTPARVALGTKPQMGTKAGPQPAVGQPPRPAATPQIAEDTSGKPSAAQSQPAEAAKEPTRKLAPQVFGGNGAPVKITDIPKGRFRTEVENLTPKSLEHTLKTLGDLQVPLMDVRSLHADPEGNLFYACPAPPPEEKKEEGPGQSKGAPQQTAQMPP